jgi:aryl-alcohol dehydrogenase-like predicted oxidoreductase
VPDNTLGSWLTYPGGFEREHTETCTRVAFEAGINFFDTANAYGNGASERAWGEILSDYQRSDYVLATKVYFPVDGGSGLSSEQIHRQIDASLERLQTDHVDLYQCHRFDVETPIEETMEALADIVKAGKARYIGASSMYAWQFCKALHVADRYGFTRFVSMQDHYNLLHREEEREMLPLCAAEGVAVLPWSPLARGRLTRDWDDGTERSSTDEFGRTLYASHVESDRRIVDRVRSVAASRGVPRAQVALAWMLSKSVVTSPIVGFSKPAHLTDALAALALRLTPEEIASLEEPYVPHPVVGFE